MTGPIQQAFYVVRSNFMYIYFKNTIIISFITHGAQAGALDVLGNRKGNKGGVQDTYGTVVCGSQIRVHVTELTDPYSLSA